jgi:hypothetical protein
MFDKALRTRPPRHLLPAGGALGRIVEFAGQRLYHAHAPATTVNRETLLISWNA